MWKINTEENIDPPAAGSKELQQNQGSDIRAAWTNKHVWAQLEQM